MTGKKSSSYSREGMRHLQKTNASAKIVLRLIREKLGLTGVEMGLLIDTHNVMISRHETHAAESSSVVPLTIIIKYCYVAGINLSDFFFMVDLLNDGKSIKRVSKLLKEVK